MRRKSSSQGNGNYNNQQRKQRFQQGGGNSGGNNRPRKNYGAMREKYLAQARDALASGDRVLAENYYQHADHCYRMMVEEGYNTRNNYTPPAQAEAQEAAPANGQTSRREEPAAAEEPENLNVLPAFLTASIEDERKGEAAAAQNWEE